MTDEFPSVLGIDGSRPNPPTDGYGLVVQNGDSNAGRAMRTAACAGGLPWPHWPLPPRPSVSISYDPRGARLPQRTDGRRTRVRPGPERRPAGKRSGVKTTFDTITRQAGSDRSQPFPICEIRDDGGASKRRIIV